MGVDNTNAKQPLNKKPRMEGETREAQGAGNSSIKHQTVDGTNEKMKQKDVDVTKGSASAPRKMQMKGSSNTTKFMADAQRSFIRRNDNVNENEKECVGGLDCVPSDEESEPSDMEPTRVGITKCIFSFEKKQDMVPDMLKKNNLDMEKKIPDMEQLEKRSDDVQNATSTELQNEAAQFQTLEGINPEQIIPKKWHSDRIQEVLQDRMMKDQQSKGRKRTLEGTNLTESNCFAILDNEVIFDIAANRGISLCVDDFEKIDIMKDLEIARHCLKNKSDAIN